MTFGPAIGAAILAALPAAYEIDCTPLPLAKTAPEYVFKLTIKLAEKPSVPLEIRVGAAADPEDAAKAIVASLGDPLWRVDRTGTRVVVYSFDKSRVTKISVTGDGPKPLIHRILLDKPVPKK